MIATIASLLQSVLLAGALSPMLEKAFLNQCVGVTQNKQACSCALKKLSKKYDLNTFIAIENGTLPEDQRVVVLSDLFSTASECFVQDECADEIDHILGKSDAKKVCECAVDRLLQMKDVEQAAIFSVGGDDFVADNEKRFEEIVSKEILPCLPKTVTPAIKANLVNECVADANNSPNAKRLCSCVTEEVFKKYSLPDFIKETFAESEDLDKFLDEALKKCKK